MLVDEGLVSVADDGGRKLASLTDAGQAYVEAHRDALGTPWERGGHGRGRGLRAASGALLGAVEQVMRTGTPEQAAAVVKVLETARRDVYRILAEDASDS